MANTTSLLDKLDSAQQGCQPAQAEETQKMIEAMRNCLQTSLAGEAQNFRSWVAAAHRKSRDSQRLALATTAGTCLFSLFILLASIWQSHRITNQAQAQLQYLRQQAAIYPDAFAELRRENLAPAGSLITQKGRTFIELRTAK